MFLSLFCFWARLEPQALQLPPLSATACQVMLLLVLMASWMSCPQLDRAPAVDMVELFAGTARCAKAARLCGKHAIALDLEFDSKVRPGAMNINSPSGYLLLSCLISIILVNHTVLICCNVFPAAFPNFRLAILCLLHGKRQELVVVIGLVCSTWVAISRGSTLRCWIHAMGDLNSPAVRASNLMTSRTPLVNTP